MCGIKRLGAWLLAAHASCCFLVASSATNGSTNCCVDPKGNLIIAKTSANHNYGLGASDEFYREDEHIAMFRAIAAELHSKP